MTFSSRILIAALAAFLVVGVGSELESGIRVVGGTAQDHEAVAWAVDRFAQAGLVAPAIEIRFHPDDNGCDGADGLFRGRHDPVRIDICTPSRLIVLHELAHAWDFYTLNDQIRREFMELRGLTEWSSHQVPWSERGVEELAEVITWGMHENPVTAGAAEKEQAFRLITGGLSPRHRERAEDEQTRAPAEDPLEGSTEWDTLR